MPFPEDEPEKAKSLFEKAGDSQSLSRLTDGSKALPLDYMALWKSAANPLLDELRRARLERAVTDHELAMEVLAAEQAGRHDILDAYIKATCDGDTPAIVARGLMVAGFCDDREEPARVLAAHAGRAGLISTAHSAAEYAFERNQWARQWMDDAIFGKSVSGKDMSILAHPRFSFTTKSPKRR